MSIDPKLVQAAYLAAVECAERSRRAEVLAQRCGSDTELRARVEALLQAHDDDDELPQVRLSSVAMDSPYICSPGTVIVGRYTLLEEIAEGGMGTVWAAQQTEPVRRRVALKLIKAGMDSRRVLSRFEVERQTLAIMDHPGIAKVFDGGLTDEGRPFFVMEYVEGEPITTYCERAQLLVHERLALFVQTCEAVQHAHQKGIIHRDLKPSNVLVCRCDDKAIPKVIDFGLAKAMREPITEQTLDSAHGLMIGTPRYMSPEQAGFNSVDIDTRTDVYSLGVILYELLTGTTPLEEQRFKDAEWQEITRLIKEEEPPKPSSRLGACLRAPSMAGDHEQAKLSRVLRGDLDSIVMKALEKERSRRYESTNELARDIERHLRHEPVEARRPSATYRFRKFARRNRVVLITAVLVSMALVAGAAVSTWQAIRATRAEHVAEDQRNAADKRRAQTEANFRDAHATLDHYFASMVESKLLDVPSLQPLRKELVGSTLAYYRQFIEHYRDDPALQAELADAHLRIGVFSGLIGSTEQALTAFQQGADAYQLLTLSEPTDAAYRAGLARACVELGKTYQRTGRLTDAEASYQRALEIRDKLALESPAVSECWADVARTSVRLGNVQAAAERLTDAEASFGRALEIYERISRKNNGLQDYQVDLADAYFYLGPVQRMAGRLADAEASFQHALSTYERLARENRTDLPFWAGVAGAHHQIGHVKRMTGRLTEAEVRYRLALELYEKLAQEAPSIALYRRSIASAHYHLGLVRSLSGRMEEANQSWTAAAADLNAAHELGLVSAAAFANLGDALAMLGQWTPAADAFSKAVDASHHDWKPLSQLALLQAAAGDEDGYRATCDDLIKRHGDTGNVSQAVGIALACAAGPRAVKDTRRILEIVRRVAASDPANPTYQTLVGAVQFRAGQTQEAIDLLVAALPLHSAAELAAPRQLAQIRASRLAGETILALAYQERNDTVLLATQLKSLQRLISELALAAPQYTDGADDWTLPLAIHCAKRELGRLAPMPDR